MLKPKRLIGIAIALLIVSLWMFFLLHSQLNGTSADPDAAMQTLESGVQAMSEFNDFLQEN